MKLRHQNGFTLIELIIVIVILGILAVTAAPRFLDISRDAKVAALNGIAGNMESTIDLAKAKARVSGLRPASENPGGGNGNNNQAGFIVDFGFGSVEVDWRNLCPESEGEGGDSLTMLDFMDISDDLQSRTTNQFTLLGFDVPASGTPTTQGCYVLYDSFGAPDCTVQVVDADC